ncbi:hypothetical protein Y032_0018g3609 [Ancylostoma ceylanicum]|uniref:Receptor L-domain domain-containing protein n=1 Tax=Ancylostoma ceylanicum TaxID=53326 RepID=A0A016V2M6_9BILA|nr:hypothetical protein Y032_0018g3609 [Ancylostoma ceylanicum]
MRLIVVLAITLYSHSYAGTGECEGGIVTVSYLTTRINGRGCTKIKGGLYFLQSDWANKQHLLMGFKKVKNITGPLHFAATKGLGHVKCFSNVQEIHPNGAAIVLLNNEGLLSLDLPSLRKLTYSGHTKAVIIHNNEGFDLDGFLDNMRKKGMKDKEFLSTSRRGFMNSIWAVLFLLPIFLALLCLLGLAAYKTAEEVGEWIKLLMKEKEAQRYRPPESQSV